MRSSLTVLTVVMILAAASVAFADVPTMINYQGRLTDGAGAPLDTTVSMEFAIYDDSTGGVLEWAEAHPSVTVEGGTFSIVLGEAVPIDDGVFNQPDRWLGITVGSDPELSPRTQLVSVGYAHRVSTVDGSTGGIISGDVSIQSDLDVDGDLRVTGKATIGTGHTNTGDHAFVAGESNSAVAAYVTIGGGIANSGDGSFSTVGGGLYNTAGSGGPADAATVGGGYENTASASTSTVAGGKNNTASGGSSTVAGGINNTADSSWATVGGGSTNSSSGWWSTVGGGVGNAANGGASTIGGGNQNITECAVLGAATVSGGSVNQATADGSTVGGGNANTASGNTSTVSGGEYNVASGDGSTVCGGKRNLAAGDYSVAMGYRDSLTENADYSLAFGDEVYIDTDHRVVFYKGTHSGRLGVNRDDEDGGINHPVHVGTDATNGNGAHLTGGGVWTNGSSREFKENFRSLDRDELLASIATMQIDSWNFKNSDEHHIGPAAEDFVLAFDVGTIREEDGTRENHYLAAGDVAGVALASVQALLNKIEKLEQRISELESQNK